MCNSRPNYRLRQYQNGGCFPPSSRMESRGRGVCEESKPIVTPKQFGFLPEHVEQVARVIVWKQHHYPSCIRLFGRIGHGAKVDQVFQILLRELRVFTYRGKPRGFSLISALIWCLAYGLSQPRDVSAERFFPSLLCHQLRKHLPCLRFDLFWIRVEDDLSRWCDVHPFLVRPNSGRDQVRALRQHVPTSGVPVKVCTSPERWRGVPDNCPRLDAPLQLGKSVLLVPCNCHLKIRRAELDAVFCSLRVIVLGDFELDEQAHHTAGDHGVEPARQMRPEHRGQKRPPRNVDVQDSPNAMCIACIGRRIDTQVPFQGLRRHKWTAATRTEFKMKNRFVLTLGKLCGLHKKLLRAIVCGIHWEVFQSGCRN